MTLVPLNDSEIDAVTQAALRATRRIVDLTDSQHGGTAVGIRLDDRYFLATAGHVLAPGHQLEVVAREGNRPVTEFVARFRDPADDIGLLELSPRNAAAIGDAFLDAQSIRVPASGTPEWSYFIVGYPGRYLIPLAKEHISKEYYLQHIGCGAFTFITQRLGEIPVATFDRIPDVGRDLFLGFDPDQNTFACPANLPPAVSLAVGKNAPPLEGMSGGGLWAMHHMADNIWLPKPHLVGIQVSYHATGKWFRATSIAAWLKLVRRHYSDLDASIAIIERQVE